MDWSASNIVTVALGKIIYLWNAGTGNIEQLREYENGDHACSLAWIQEGNVLAIGSSDGTVELWDAEAKKRSVEFLANVEQNVHHSSFNKVVLLLLAS